MITTKMIFIYRLICPIEKTVRYIGITSNPEGRLLSHRSEYTNNSKKIWINNLRKKKLIPKMEIIDMVEESLSKEFEAYYIKKYLENNCDLLNVINNGRKKRAVKIKFIKIDEEKIKSKKRVEFAKIYLKGIKKDSSEKPIK